MTKRRGLGRGLDAIIPKRSTAGAADSAAASAPETAKKAAEAAPEEKSAAGRTGKKTSAAKTEGQAGSAKSTKSTAATKGAKTTKASKAAKAADNAQMASPAPAQGPRTAEVSAEGVRMVRTALVEPNREQPRRTFDETALTELTDSVKKLGILQPLLVKPVDNHFEIIAGERRWRAARAAGLKEIPVVVRSLEAQQVLEAALVENIQREDLSPVEEARAYKRLQEEFSLKQDEIAARVSKSRTAVANSMRLLRLSPEVLEILSEGKITEGHARALLQVSDASLQKKLAELIVARKLSVRDAERLAAQAGKPRTKKTASKEKNGARDALFKDLESSMKRSLGTKVQIEEKQGGGGKITIEYYDDKDLDRLYSLLTGVSS